MNSFLLQLAIIALITFGLCGGSIADDPEGKIEPSPDFLGTGFDEFVKSFPEETPDPEFDRIRTGTLNGTFNPPDTRDEKEAERIDDNLSKRDSRIPIYIGMTRTFDKQSNGDANFYINGDLSININAENPIRFLKMYASTGDVLAVSASHTEGLNGVAIALKIGPHFFLTGGGGFKAKPSFKSSRWNRPTYRACSWCQPVTQAIPPEKDLRDAEYVWARNAGKKGVFIRFVIDGEDCSKPSPKLRKYQHSKRSQGTRSRSKHSRHSKNPKRSPRPERSRRQKRSPNSGRSIDSHANISRHSEALCDCKQVAHQPDGDCYEFVTIRVKNGKKVQSSRKCIRSTCGDNYECVKNGDPFTAQCVLKLANSKVSMIKRLSRDVFKCRRILLKKPTALLVPHED